MQYSKTHNFDKGDCLSSINLASCTNQELVSIIHLKDTFCIEVVKTSSEYMNKFSNGVPSVIYFSIHNALALSSKQNFVRFDVSCLSGDEKRNVVCKNVA